MIRINLLPVRASRKKQESQKQLLLIGLALAFVVLCNLLWSHSRAEDLASREAKIKRTRTEIAQLERIIGEVKNIKAQQSELKDKLAVLDRLKAGRQGPVRLLDELATLVPARLWLRKVEEKSGAIAFEGTAGTIDDVSSFLTALKGSRHFKGVELKKTVAKPEGRLKVVDFTITAAANYTPQLEVASAAGPAAAGGTP